MGKDNGGMFWCHRLITYNLLHLGYSDGSTVTVPPLYPPIINNKIDIFQNEIIIY
jgi:hypothetical protein